jgi:hypothetical protein
MSLETLQFLQLLLHQQTLSVGADDDHIAAVLRAKQELATAIEAAQNQ